MIEQRRVNLLRSFYSQKLALFCCCIRSFQRSGRAVYLMFRCIRQSYVTKMVFEVILVSVTVISLRNNSPFFMIDESQRITLIKELSRIIRPLMHALINHSLTQLSAGGIVNVVQGLVCRFGNTLR